MKLDIAANELMKEKEIFADIWNAVFFRGEPVIDRKELTEEAGVTAYTDRRGKRRKLLCDCRKYVRNALLGEGHLILENQTKICNTMPLRKMGYVYTAYQEQVRTYKDRNRAAGRNAYAAEIFADQKLFPVLLIVLYWGEEPWEQPCSLQDMLTDVPGEADSEAEGKIGWQGETGSGMESKTGWQRKLDFRTGNEIRRRGKSELPLSWKEMADDYRLSVIQLAHLPQKVRESLQSDLRLVADYMAYRHDWEKFCECVRNSTKPLKHMGKVLDVLEALSGDGRFRKIRKLFEEEYLGTEREETAMCEMLDRIEAIGREDGLRQGREAGLRQGREAGLRQGREAGLRQGMERGRRAGLKDGRREGILSSIQNLMESMSWTAEQAMQALKIPKKEQAFYLKKLS